MILPVTHLASVIERIEKEYKVFETKDNYFKVRKILFMKKKINWQFDVKDGIGEWSRITLFNLTHEAIRNLENCLRRKVEKPDLGSLEYMGRRRKRLNGKLAANDSENIWR